MGEGVEIKQWIEGGGPLTIFGPRKGATCRNFYLPFPLSIINDRSLTKLEMTSNGGWH